MVEIDHPQAGLLRQARPAARFSQSPVSYRKPAPALGADSQRILSHLGLDDREIEELSAEGVTSFGPNEESAS